MNEGIFGFNKALIDTVYEAICFAYPVTGSDRDFARFFVLETVARVPYFAYLSVMHLRETFGDRDVQANPNRDPNPNLNPNPNPNPDVQNPNPDPDPDH